MAKYRAALFSLAAFAVTLAAAPRADAAAVMRQQAVTSRGNDTANVAPSWTMTTSAGSLLIAVVSLHGTSSTTITPPASKGWTLARRADEGSVTVAIYYVPGSFGGTQSGSSSWAVTGGAPAAVQLIEYTGVQSASPLDVTAGNTGVGTTASVTASSLTAQASELAVTGITGFRRPDLTVETGGYAQVGTTEQSAGDSGETGNRISEAAFQNLYTGSTAPATTVTLSTNRDWAIAVATFKVPVTPKYWICSGASTFATVGCWSNSSGGSSNGSTPATTDVVVFDSGGGNCSISATRTVGAIELRSTYTGTVTLAASQTFTASSDFSVAGGTFTGGSGGTLAFNSGAASLHISGGTVNGGGSALSPANVEVSGTGTFNTGAGTLSASGGLNQTGGAISTGGTVTVAGISFVSGGTFTNATASKVTTFSSTLALSGTGAVRVNAGTFTVTGDTTMSGSATLDGASGGTVNFNSRLIMSGGTVTTASGTFTLQNHLQVGGGTYKNTGTTTTNVTNTSRLDLTGAGAVLVSGGTMHVTRAVSLSDTSTYTAAAGTTNTFDTTLTVNTGTTFDLGGGSLTVSGAMTVAGGTFTGTGSSTLDNTLDVTSGTYDASSGSSTVAGLATISGGTYKIGSSATGQTMSAGMTISGGTLDGSSATGALKLAASQTLAVESGTLQTSTASTTGPTFGAAGVAWTFSVTGGTVNLNGAKLAGTTGTNGLNIGASATISKLDHVDFANVPTTNPGSATYLLTINQATLSLHSTGCKFDYNPSTFSNLKTVRLTDSNTTVDVRAWFQFMNAATNGAAAGDAYDADEDTAPDDGVGDVGNKAVVYWSYTIITDTAGAIQGVPTAAFDWNTGAYYSTYAVYRDASGTTDRLYVRDANGDPVSYYDIPTANGNVVGTPLWTTESSVHVVYLATSTGRIYRLIDTNGTLAASSGTWATYFSSGTVVSITSPMIDDGTNLYFGGTTTGAANRVFGVSKSAKTLVKNVTTAANISAAPSWKINTATSTTYLFVGSAFVTNQAYLYRINMVPTGAVDATCCGTSVTSTSIGSSTRLANSILYAGDGSAKLHALDAMNLGVGGFVNKSGWPYQDSNATRHSPVTVGAIQGAPWVDTAAGRLFYGDNDGHLYQLTTAGALVTNYPIRLTTTNQLRSSPIYLSGSGVVVIGDSGGNVYYVDVKNASSAPALMYTTTLSGAVSSISYNANTAQYMVGTASGVLEMLPVKVDPTPTFTY
jgi:hypothetical protein